MCVTLAWDGAILGLKKGGVEITPTVSGLLVVRDRGFQPWADRLPSTSHLD